MAGGHKIKYSYEDLIKHLGSVLKVNGLILTEISDLQDIYEPNRPSNHSWSGFDDYASFTVENFNKIFSLKNKIDSF